ncbi:unnamed protein product [Pseudo-nitzschia multistriata]|uniref:Uncharacterized protein n=1 Tax=Pseudo-nitzschia multistriata TaxID=183589 RepID=A0A448YWR2_9STRA|nr:unnamed protein product [Pseudo-nitzschia multistriata]
MGCQASKTVPLNEISASKTAFIVGRTISFGETENADDSSVITAESLNEEPPLVRRNLHDRNSFAKVGTCKYRKLRKMRERRREQERYERRARVVVVVQQ